MAQLNQTYTLHTSSDPEHFGWMFAQHKLGQRVTKDLLTCDLADRNNVHVNCYGVVLFYDRQTAEQILNNHFFA